MAKRITSGKREREKIKQTKRLDKQRKREERQSSGSRNFEEMLAYVAVSYTHLRDHETS